MMLAVSRRDQGVPRGPPRLFSLGGCDAEGKSGLSSWSRAQVSGSYKHFLMMPYATGSSPKTETTEPLNLARLDSIACLKSQYSGG